MSKVWIVDDGLWELIEPLLPPWPDKAPGPRPVPDRLCLQGTLFVLHTGIGLEDLPQELGFGSGMTCWRRLQRWSEAGVFDHVHQILLARLNTANRIVSTDRRRRGRPRRRFATLLADKGYSSDAFRQACRERGTEPIACILICWRRLINWTDPGAAMRTRWNFASPAKARGNARDRYVDEYRACPS